eukprot:XP_001706891.1 Hypothetical protein GL50803_32736 [Giardia lamblia ATCC 50803]
MPESVLCCQVLSSCEYPLSSKWCYFKLSHVGGSSCSQWSQRLLGPVCTRASRSGDLHLPWLVNALHRAYAVTWTSKP